MAFYGLYFLIPDDVLKSVYATIFIDVIVKAIHIFSPGELITPIVNSLHSSTFAFEIVRGCDGFGATFLFIAAILAQSARWKFKVVSVALFILTMYALNLIRIFALFYISAYNAKWFVPVHSYFAPMIIILIGCALFISCLERLNNDNATTA